MGYYCQYNSPVGKLTLVSDGEKLIALKGEKHRYYDYFCDSEQEKDDLKIFVKTKRWLDKYFNGEKPQISEIEYVVTGSEFRKDVWEILCKIPYGKIVTYKDIAVEIAKKRGIARMSAQAVGNAVGHNPISIIIPCHRVIGTNGNLTGYGGGMKMKVKLLELEKVDMSKLTIPTKGTAI